MNMYFGASQNVCVLLEDWHVTNGVQYFGTVLAILAFAFFREWVTAYRSKRHFDSSRPASSVNGEAKTGSTASNYQKLSAEEPAGVSAAALQMYTWKSQLGDSGWYLLNLTTAYLLMLIFMTYNVGLCITVLFGCFFGHFFWTFRYKSQMKAAMKPAEADHCCAE